MHAAKSLIFAVIALAVLTVPLAGQRRIEHEGFWLGLGAAPGVGKCTLELRCSTASKLGIAGWVAAGGTISERVLVGIEANGWAHSEPDTVRQFGSVTATLVFYPIEEGPFYGKAGIGAGRYAEDAAGQILTANGFAFVLGAGADLAVSSRLAIVPFVQYVVSNRQTAKRSRFPIEGALLDFSMIQLGVGARWQ